MLEACHGVMQRSLQAKYATILKFIQLLEKGQGLQEFIQAQIRAGRDLLAQRVNNLYINVNKRLARLYKISSYIRMIHLVTLGQ